MRWNRFLYIVVTMCAVALLMGCRSKKEVIKEDKTSIESNIVTKDSISKKHSTESEIKYSDSVFVYVVDSIYKDSAGVVHHEHIRKEIVKQNAIQKEKAISETERATSTDSIRNEKHQEIEKEKISKGHSFWINFFIPGLVIGLIVIGLVLKMK